jgi:hypothetical protein
MEDIERRLFSLIGNISYWKFRLYKINAAETKESFFEIRRCEQLLKAVIKDLDKIEKDRS